MSIKEKQMSALTEYREVLKIIKQNQNKENWLRDTDREINKLIRDAQSYWNKYKKCVDEDRAEVGECYMSEALAKLDMAEEKSNKAIDFIMKIPKYLADIDMKSAMLVDYVKYKDKISLIRKTLSTYNKNKVKGTK